MVVHLGHWIRFTYAYKVCVGTLGSALFLCGCSSDSMRFSKASSSLKSAGRTQWVSNQSNNSEMMPPAPIGVGAPTSYRSSFESKDSESDIYTPPSQTPPSQRFHALPPPIESQTHVVREALPTPSAAPPPKKENVASLTPKKTDGDTKGWTSQGGTWIITTKGDTVKRLSDRYGVPGTVIEAMNALPEEASLKPGTHIIIPVYRGESAQSTREQSGSKVAALNGPQGAEPARSVTKLETSLQKPSEPSTSRTELAPPPVPALSQTEKKSVVRDEAPALKDEPVQETVASSPSPGLLRWPVRGRVITQFNAGGNEGINIAVPTGTPVKAAEDGVVAYAGEELKGYGKLILIRHTNGLISAYAHNSSLLVAKGDKVRRGQNISLSGQTGSVTSPQLHFEVRQGAVPIDPIPRLESSNNF